MKLIVGMALAAIAPAAAAQWTYPAYSGPDPHSRRPWRAVDIENREAALKRRESAAARLEPVLARDKAAACAEYGRRLDDVRDSGRRAGNDARHMEHLNELRRRLDAARFSAGC